MTGLNQVFRALLVFDKNFLTSLFISSAHWVYSQEFGLEDAGKKRHWYQSMQAIDHFYS